jgi:hypothetical protein
MGKDAIETAKENATTDKMGNFLNNYNKDEDEEN